MTKSMKIYMEKCIFYSSPKKKNIPLLFRGGVPILGCNLGGGYETERSFGEAVGGFVDESQ